MDNKVYYDVERDRFYAEDKVNNCYPITLCYNIGYNCNLSCDYCLAKHRKSRIEKMNILDVVDLIKGWRPLRIVISGGEPLMYSNELYKVLVALKENGINTFVSTNGILVEETYSDLKGLIDWYDISLPALKKQSYSKIRGDDKFETVVKAIDFLVNKNKRVRLTFTINGENINEIHQIPRFVMEHGISNLRLSHTYSYNDCTIACKLWNNQLKKFFSTYEDKIDIYYPLSDDQLENYNMSYLIFEKDGSVYTGSVNDDKYLFHIKDIEKNKERILDIGKLQLELFCGN